MFLRRLVFVESGRHPWSFHKLEAYAVEVLDVLVEREVRPEHLDAEEVFRVGGLVPLAERGEEEAAGLQPRSDRPQQSELIVAWQVEDDVERDDRVERRWCEVDGREIGADERRAGDVLPRQRELGPREVDADDGVVSRERPCNGD